MGYNYREVICPYCQHKFMWQHAVQDGSSWPEYRNQDTNEVCLSAKCPGCSQRMIVSKESVSGIKKESYEYSKIIVRGI